MKNSWTKTFRRLAAGAMVAGATAFSSAMCYANAYDDATDPVYANGWQGTQHDDDGNLLATGDNGGTGFTAWNFDTGFYYWPDAPKVYQYANPGFNGVDDGLGNSTAYSNPNNNIGKAWVMGQTASLPDVMRAGRGLLQPLQIGQTFRTVIDSPTVRPAGGGYVGYNIRLIGNTGGTDGNICNAYGANCTPHNPVEYPSPEMHFQVFHGPGGDPGGWHIVDDASVDTGLDDTDTAVGAPFQVTRTSVTDYDVLMDPIGPGPVYASTRTFDNPGVDIDWIEYEFYNASGTATPTGYSDMATTPTDLYIRSMEVVPEPGTGVLIVLGIGTLLGLGTARRRREA